jgi:DNA modification methylase
MPSSINLQAQQSTQLRLPGIEPEPQSKMNNNNGSGFSDPSFAGNKTEPIHRWVPWIAGFSRDFVRDALTRYLNSNRIVLDPFCGVGTTLVEALLHGHNAIGFEINPYAVLACRTKANAYRVDVDKLNRELEGFRAFFSEKVSSGYVPKSVPPKGFKTRAKFYSPKVLRKVLILQDFVEAIEDSTLRDVFRLAFASTMVKYSNYSYEPSLGRRVSAGKPEIVDFPVGQTILRKLTEMREDVAWFQDHLPDEPPRVQVIHGSFFDYEQHLQPATVDLLVTSPPYLNNYHYNRNTRPHLYWLGYAERPQDLEPLEQMNFGKYWQTVRGLGCVNLDFSLPNTDIAERLEALRSLKPERGVYGGNGWANYAAAYFNDCHRFAEGISYALKPGSTALVVIGNSILQGILIPTDQYFGKIAESTGLELVEIHIPRGTRVGNSIIQSEVRVVKAKDSHRLYEAVVELRKVPKAAMDSSPHGF